MFAHVLTLCFILGLNCVFVNKENCGKIFGHLCITSSSSHFFNKTDFEQYFSEEVGFVRD